MAEYKTLSGLDLDIGGFTESITRSKKTLEEVSRKGRGIGVKPETEEPELDDGFLAGIAEVINLFRENGYEPIQPSEDSTTTPKDKVLDEYAELMKSEIIQDAMKEVSTLGESPNKLEDIYTSMDTYTATFDDQPTVDSEGETLEIEQTEPLGLMSKVSPVVTSEKPIMAETPTQSDLKVDVDSEILSPTFLNAIGITGSLTKQGVQDEVKKVLKEQGMSDEEIANLVNNSLAAIDADEVQPTDIPEFSEEELRLSFTEYPSNKEKAIAYASDIYPNNKVAAAALAATIQFEGMKNSVEEIGINEKYSLKKVLHPNTKKAPLKRNDQKIYEILGFPKQTDDDGNIIYLERPKMILNKEVQEALNKKGIDVGNVDGIIGKNTISGIKRFQKIKGLNVTGKLDPETYKKLNIEYRELDHVGQPIAMHVVKNPPENIPPDKAEEIFDIRYNDHYKSRKMGNVGDKKFATYRGRGPIQITGMDTYRKVGDAIGVDLIKNPDLLVTNNAVSKAAVKAYLKMRGFSNYSTPEEMLKSINPGEKGIVETRFPTYEKYLKEIN